MADSEADIPAKIKLWQSCRRPFAGGLFRCYHSVSFVLVRHLYIASDRNFGLAREHSRQEPGPNKIVTELPPKVFLTSEAFGPIVPYHQDRAKLKP